MGVSSDQAAVGVRGERVEVGSKLSVLMVS